MDKTVPTVEVGELFMYTTVMDGQTIPIAVHASCGEDQGQWFCVLHDSSFANNMMWNNHLDEPGRHRAVWMCHTHGPEVP